MVHSANCAAKKDAQISFRMEECARDMGLKIKLQAWGKAQTKTINLVHSDQNSVCNSIPDPRSIGMFLCYCAGHARG